MTDPIEAMARAIGGPLANMNGGCFNPHEEPRGECADAQCYCARVCRHAATAAYAALRETLVPVGWMYNYIKPVGDRKHIDPPFALLGQRANMDPRYRTETPLYALPEIKP